MLKNGLGGFPKVQFVVELAPQAFDLQQGFLQQHQLRLNLIVEAPRHLKQPQQKEAERDVLQRSLPDRLADGANGAFKRLDTGALRNPAALHMQLGHAPVIAVEEGQEVFGQIALMILRELAHDAEIHGQVAGRRRVARIHENVAGVHVGMKKIVAERLLEKDLDAAFGQHLKVHAHAAQPVQLTDGNALDALHHQHVGPGKVPENDGVINERAAQQVQLVGEDVLKLGDDGQRTQPPRQR